MRFCAKFHWLSCQACQIGRLWHGDFLSLCSKSKSPCCQISLASMPSFHSSRPPLAMVCNLAKASLGPSVTGGGVNPNVYFKKYVPASWQRMKMKGVFNQLLVCSDHRILSNTHFRSHMKHEDELPFIEGLLALKACSNVKRMYSWAEQLSDLAFPYRGERVQRL